MPRFLHCFYAWLLGYFWLPCPLCKQKFGGHEWSETLWTSYDSGQGVCPKCAEKAKELNLRFLQEHQPDPVVSPDAPPCRVMESYAVFDDDPLEYRSERVKAADELATLASFLIDITE